MIRALHLPDETSVRALGQGTWRMPDAALPAAQAKGRERYEGFVEALGRQLARGRLLADEISRDIAGDEGGEAAAEGS